METHPPLRVVALLNVLAGSVDGRPGEEIRDTVRSAFAARGISCEVEGLSGGKLADAASQALEKAKRNEVDAIIAGGGDGTIHTVAGVLAGTGVPLGILPLGTLNHFAKDLGIPMDLDGAVDVVAAAHGVNVDVGDVNGIIFINNSSIGVYPYMVLDRERLRRRAGLRKWTAMVIAGLHMVRVFPVRRLRVRAEGWVEPCRTPCLFVGNNKYTLSLTAPRKRERLDAGELWFYIVKHQTRLSLLWFTLRSLLGLADSERDLHTFGAKQADIAARERKKRVAVALDGEVAFLRPPLHYRIRAGELLVYAPIPTEP
ncbi:MAG TPA: diacylglycerol kinase family protein [Micropepsaceae bacterium]|nr:diacylglycerol kinase family protein [Micropepsaceae bacterium]